MGTFIIQPHTRLQEWVAEENGYFTDEGLDQPSRGSLSYEAAIVRQRMTR